MDKFYICGTEAINLSEILFIAGLDENMDDDCPITLKFKNNFSMEIDVFYAKKIVLALKKAIKEEITASPAELEQPAAQ